jgi:pimeloyl-ACP methyl ester carboxylesterase
MWKYRFLIFVFLLFVSCKNTYKYASKYSSRILKKNGLVFHSLNLEKYNVTYWDSGTAKPVLILIHGFGTSGKFQWFKESADLSENYRLIIVNLLYFGSTSKTPTYTVSGQVEAIEGLLEKLDIRSCNVCGTSYGGVIAAQFTVKHPEKVKKLILMDVPLKFLTEADTKNVCDSYGITDPQELYVPSDPEMFKKLISITYLKEPSKSMVQSFYKHTYQEKEEDLRKIYQTFLNENKMFADMDYHFKMPVLLIWGQQDRLVPLHVGQELKKHIGSNARLEIVPKAAHLPNLENKKIVDKLILSFLNEE